MCVYAIYIYIYLASRAAVHIIIETAYHNNNNNIQYNNIITKPILLSHII